jgi:hypothetical protein
MDNGDKQTAFVEKHDTCAKVKIKLLDENSVAFDPTGYTVKCDIFYKMVLDQPASPLDTMVPIIYNSSLPNDDLSFIYDGEEIDMAKAGSYDTEKNMLNIVTRVESVKLPTGTLCIGYIAENLDVVFETKEIERENSDNQIIEPADDLDEYYIGEDKFHMGSDAALTAFGSIALRDRYNEYYNYMDTYAVIQLGANETGRSGVFYVTLKFEKIDTDGTVLSTFQYPKNIEKNNLKIIIT